MTESQGLIISGNINVNAHHAKELIGMAVTMDDIEIAKITSVIPHQNFDNLFIFEAEVKPEYVERMQRMLNPPPTEISISAEPKSIDIHAAKGMRS